MSQESIEKGCCCCCSQCPPWWVTMGFVPPLQIPQAKAAAPTTAPAPTTTTTTTPTPPDPLGGLGTILGGVLGGI